MHTLVQIDELQFNSAIATPPVHRNQGAQSRRINGADTGEIQNDAALLYAGSDRFAQCVGFVSPHQAARAVQYSCFPGLFSPHPQHHRFSNLCPCLMYEESTEKVHFNVLNLRDAHLGKK
jgi:hypothetical protein